MSYKHIAIFIILTVCLSEMNGQINTYSPYSRFGLGEIHNPGNIRSLGMGSSGIALRSNKQINYINPASFTATDTLSFLFDFGMYGFYNTYHSNESSASLGNFNLHHLSFSFPVTKWWKASAGIFPYTSVGYNIQEPSDIPNVGNVNFYYNGNGGLNKLYFGNSVEFFNSLSVGISLEYLFGNIFYARRLSLDKENMGAIPRIENKLVVGGMVYNFGLQYYKVFKEKYFITLGAAFENKPDIKSTSHLLSELNFPGKSAMVGDSILLSTLYIIQNETSRGTIKYPGNLGLGLSFGIHNKLVLSADYYRQDWSNALIMSKNDSLVNSTSANFGIEFTPSGTSVQNYFGRINYRIGAYFTNSYISIRNQQIKDSGMTFGIGLPLRSTQTTFNVAYILGTRGTLHNELIKENYDIWHIGVTLHDIWFRKRKYD